MISRIPVGGHLIQLRDILLVVLIECSHQGRPTTTHVPIALLWRKDVSLKVSVFAWRHFRNRFPSKTNLFRRGIISPEAQLCVSGYGCQESETHLFLSCRLLASYGSWLGNGLVYIQQIHLTSWIIFISLVPLPVLANHDAL